MPYYQLEFYNEYWQVAMGSWKTVFLLPANGEPPTQLLPELHRGQLVYRLPGKSKRISYRQLKKGLIKKATHLFVAAVDIPF